MRGCGSLWGTVGGIKCENGVKIGEGETKRRDLPQ